MYSRGSHVEIWRHVETFPCWYYAYVGAENQGPGIPSLLPHWRPICMSNRPVCKGTSGESSNYSHSKFSFFKISPVSTSSLKTPLRLRESSIFNAYAINRRTQRTLVGMGCLRTIFPPSRLQSRHQRAQRMSMMFAALNIY